MHLERLRCWFLLWRPSQQSTVYTASRVWAWVGWLDRLQHQYDMMISSLLNQHAPWRLARCHHQPATPFFDADCTVTWRKLPCWLLKVLSDVYAAADASNVMFLSLLDCFWFGGSPDTHRLWKYAGMAVVIHFWMDTVCLLHWRCLLCCLSQSCGDQS